MSVDWQNELPLLTVERVQKVIERDRLRWRMNLSAVSGGHPRLGFRGAAELAAAVEQLQAATDAPTVRRRDDLRRVVEEILYRHWLRVYDHHPDRIARNAPLLGFPIPAYRTPEELTGASLSYQDATQELWQRDIGDALPALALAAHLFPDIAALCRERMKAFVLATLDFPTWGTGEKYTDMDLAVDHIARGIAVVYDWHRDLWNDSEREHLFIVLRQKLGTLLQGAYGTAFWKRSWTDNHCQNAYAALGICGTCFLGEIAEAEEWLGAAVAGFEYALPLCNADGSSTEGVPYWSYGMSFLLQYIELTRQITGADSLYEFPYLRNAAEYRLHCSLPDLSGTVTLGDAQLQDYYGPSHLLYALARQYQDGVSQWLGDTIRFANRSGADVEAWVLLWRDPELEPSVPAAIPVDYHLPDWDMATTRSGWSKNDYAIAVKSGYTNRNHSHLDAGTLLFGWGDEWIIDAPGYGEVGPGFWDRGGGRWEYYSNSTESHTTLLIDGKNQRFDAQARGTITTFASDGDCCQMIVDLTEAYDGVASVRRTIFHRRGKYILVWDTVTFPTDFAATHCVEWLLQPGKNTVVQDAENVVVIQGKQGTLKVQALGLPGSPSPIFAPRAPSTPHLDVPPDAVKTRALTADATASAQFAVLLVPGTTAAITARLETGEQEGIRARISVDGNEEVLLLV